MRSVGWAEKSWSMILLTKYDMNSSDLKWPKSSGYLWIWNEAKIIQFATSASIDAELEFSISRYQVLLYLKKV